MRRIVVAMLMFGVVAGAFAPANAARAVTRTILLPTAATEPQGPLACPNGSGCRKTPVSRVARCHYLLDQASAQDATTGKFGYVVSVASTEAGKKFTLNDATGLPATLDFDVVFYATLGGCVGEPLEAGPTPSPATSFGRIGNESGTVPAGTKFAIVTLFGAANGKFTLTLGI